MDSEAPATGISALRRALRAEAFARWVGETTHALNNALMSVVGQSDLLALEAGGGERVQTILRAGERARDLARRMLYAARCERRLAEARARQDLGPWVRRAADRLRASLPDLALVVEEGLPEVEADGEQVERAVLALCLATLGPAGSPGRGVRLRLEREEAPGSAPPAVPGVAVRVGDAPAGAAPSEAGPWAGEDRPADEDVLLYLASRLARDSGGVLRCEEEAGPRLLFPPAPTEAEGESEAAAEPPAEGAGRGGQGPPTVLLVEDEEGIRGFCREALEGGGFRVIEARAAEEALARLASHEGSLDLVVADVVLPGMNGVELLRHVRASHPAARGLCISGYTGESIERSGMLGSGTAFLAKPFTSGELLARVRGILEAR